ncbi:MAG: alpha/beta fold hydrolase [Bryobacteraceae bacterium]
MFARLLWKAGLGAALLMLTACREAEAAKTPEERAREVVEMLAAGKYAAVHQMFSQEMQDGLPVGTLMGTVAPVVKPLGKLLETGKASVQRMGENTVVIVPAYFEKGALDYTVTFNGSGQIAGLWMKPGQKPKTAPAVAPAAVQKTAQTPEERAREVVALLLAEKYESLYEMSTPEMQKALPVEALRNKVGPIVMPLGKLLETGKPSINKMGVYTVIVLPAKFEATWIDFTISVNEAGQIGGLFMRPGQGPLTEWQRPAYSKPDSFTEREVTVGAGEWKLPGTLTLPKTQKPAPGVVLVHGSGPNDRDETVFGVRPFRDLAEGLASAGIAVLRYDKRTKVYGAKMVALKNLTVQEETVDDAILAAAVLRSQPEVDPRRVFILGHSLGAYVLPMILKQDPKAAGGIGMAGIARPLEDVVLEQVEYLIPLQTAQSEEARKEGQKKLEEIRQTVAAIKALQPGQEDGPSLVGMPPHYLLALRSYDPPAMAATLHVPLLILQGERDYQVSMVDFAKWKAALGGRKEDELKSYPALNHLFVEGSGKSTPSEYSQPGHVAAEAVGDIARWVAAH